MVSAVSPPEFENALILLLPVVAAVLARGFAEYLLLTRSHPVIAALAKAVKAAAIPFAVAFYVALITRQIQMGM